MIFFTGTGNSAYIAGKISQTTGDRVVSMNDKIKAGDYRTGCCSRVPVFFHPEFLHVIYCVKDAPTDFMNTGLWQLVSIAVVAISYKLKHNTLLSLVLGTVCYMVLIRLNLF